MRNARPRARLTVYGRWLLVMRVERRGWTAAAAEAAGVSRETVYRWLRRFAAEGGVGLEDRSSTPLTNPKRLGRGAEARICQSLAHVCGLVIGMVVYPTPQGRPPSSGQQGAHRPRGLFVDARGPR
ncbi:MAG: leucine zipper domain-containing protein [Candidatus Dormibacteria bacterium]